MKNWLEYIPFIIIAKLVHLMPRRMALAFGRGLGKLVMRLSRKIVRRAENNLRLALPELDDKDIPGVLDEIFRNMGMSFIEMLRLDYYLDKQKIEQHMILHDLHHLDEALALKRGCIILTGHVGFWETGTIYLPYAGYDIGFVAKPMRNHLVDNYFVKMREAAGGYLINSKKGARGIFKALQNNHAVCVLMDQHIKGRGTAAVPFFGRPAHTTTIITEMAMKYRIPVIPAFVHRTKALDYEGHIQPMILLEGEPTPENIAANTARLNTCIEDAIREELPQWFWVHRRWRDCCEQESA